MVGNGFYGLKMEEHTLYSIGYGTFDVDEFVQTLKRYDIQYLIDVRSRPYSKFKPDFTQTALRNTLKITGIEYVYMGDLLGGTPEDPTCYTEGKADYDKIEMTEKYRQGIDRLVSAYRQAFRVCLMCSEGKPEYCHRSKLIGNTLEKRGVPIVHITPDGALLNQHSVMDRITKGQEMFFELLLTSRKSYDESGKAVS